MIKSTEMIARLLTSAIMGGIIGIERERTNRPAGFRTHILVTMGAALMMIISTTAFNPLVNNNDPMRLAAQVVSGIGFLGAGTVLKDGANVKGLTTAAALWVCGGIGLAIGAGMYIAGISTTLISFFSLTILNRIEKKLIAEKFRKRLSKKLSKNDLGLVSNVVVIRDTEFGFTKDIETILSECGYYAKEITFKSLDKNSKYIEITIHVLKLDDKSLIGICDDNSCLTKINELPGIKEMKLDY